MLEHFDISISNAFRQTLGGFGVIYILAFLLWLVSRKRRNYGAGVMGRAYCHLVAPGVAFHEISHAIGCWLTLTRVQTIVLFEIKDGHLGYVVHNQPSGRILGPIKNFIIATGPVWMGCLAVVLFGCFLSGSGFLPVYEQTFGSTTPGIVEYALGVVMAALGMFVSIVCVWNWTSPLYLIALYLFFCITSEIVLSDVDISQTWKGLLFMVAFIFLFNLLPGINVYASRLSDWASNGVFVIHSSLVFVLMVDVVFLMLFKMLGGVLRTRELN